MTNNPFTAKVRAKSSSAQQTKKSGSTSGKLRPFTSASRSVPQRFSIGERVRVKWRYSEAYGPGSAEFTGAVVSIDGNKIHLRDNRDVNLHHYMSMLESAEKI